MNWEEKVNTKKYSSTIKDNEVKKLDKKYL